MLSVAETNRRRELRMQLCQASCARGGSGVGWGGNSSHIHSNAVLHLSFSRPAAHSWAVLSSGGAGTAADARGSSGS